MIKGSDYIAKKLKSFGLDHVFMVTGGGAMHLNDSFSRTVPFEVIYNHHEQASAIAAEGLFRATGKVGIVNITTGPGGLNTLTGLMGQWTDSIPVVYISGQVKFETTVMSCPEKGLRQLGDQEVNIIEIVRPLTKYAVAIKKFEDLQFEIEKAWYIANSGRKGPVWIDVPMNIQGGVFYEANLRAYIPEEPIEYDLQIERVIECLAHSERPVIVAGHGIRLSGELKNFASIIKDLKIPVLVTFNGVDQVGSDNDYYCGRIGTIGTRGGNFTLQNADLVLLLGTRNNIRQVSYNWENFAHRAKTICVDLDKAELDKPTFKADINIFTDLADFIPAFLSALQRWENRKDFGNWLAWAKERTRLYPGARPVHYSTKDLISPYAFIDSFTKALPHDAVVVAGNGSACVVMFQAGYIKTGQRVFWNAGCAAMGYDLPAAIGAVVGVKNDVWCISGDGSFQMNLQELATISFNQLPVKIVYLNNGGYASIRQTQSNFFHAQYGCGPKSGLGFPNIERLASAYDMPYIGTNSILDVANDLKKVIENKGPVIWEIFLQLDYSFEPKLSSEKLPDGRMVSKPLEDMFPFLSRDEFASNMIYTSSQEPTKETGASK